MTNVDGVPLLAAQVDVAEMEALREMADWFRDSVPSGVAVLGAANDGKVILLAAVTEDLVPRGVKAGEIVGQVAGLVGGGGGGRPTLAQAGGRQPEKLPAALAAVPEMVRRALNG